MGKQTQLQVTSANADASERATGSDLASTRGTRGNAAALEDSGLAGEARDDGWYDAMAGAMLEGEVATLDVPDRVTAVAEIRDQLQKLTDWHQTVVNDMVRDLDAANTRLATEKGPALEECVRALLIDAITVEVTAAFGTLGPLVGRVLRLGGLQGPGARAPTP